jgi:hypothetical protein
MKVYVVLEHEPDPYHLHLLRLKRIVCITSDEATARVTQQQGALVRTLECWEVDGAEVLL